MREKIFTFCVALLLCFAQGCTEQPASKAEESRPETQAAAIPVSPEKTDAAEPAMAAAPDGSVYVVWVEHRPESKADVFLRKINPDNTMESPVRVNSETGMAMAWRGDPPTLAVAPNGELYVVWTGRSAPKGHESDLYLSASRDGGKSFAPPVKINDDKKPARHGMHSLAVDKDGRIFLAWLDERNLAPAAPMEKHRGEMAEKESNNEVFAAFSEDGGRTISPNQQIAREACPCCKTALTVAPDGRVYLGFRQVLKGDYRHIAVASSTDKGRSYTSPVIISDDQWVIAACPVSGPALLAGDGGLLRVLWYTEGRAGEQGLYLTESRDGGQTYSARKLVTKGNVRGNPLLVNGASKAAAIWQTGESSSSGLMRSDLTAEGGVNGSAVLLNEGDLPAVTVSRSDIFTAYISSHNKQRGIWLKRAGKL